MYADLISRLEGEGSDIALSRDLWARVAGQNTADALRVCAHYEALLRSFDACMEFQKTVLPDVGCLCFEFNDNSYGVYVEYKYAEHKEVCRAWLLAILEQIKPNNDTA
jgi:hypothetical protein